MSLAAQLDGDIKTNAVFRDRSKCHGIILFYLYDTTKATAADRVSIYINGTEQTSLATSTYPSQNREVNFNRTVAHHVLVLTSNINHFVITLTG